MVRQVLLLDGVAEQPELLADLVDLRLVSGQELPRAAVDAEALGIVVQHLASVVLGIDGDRVEEHVVADALAEQVVHGGHARRLHRAHVGAAREDEVHRDDLALDDVVEEAKLLARVGGELVIGRAGRRGARHALRGQFCRPKPSPLLNVGSATESTYFTPSQVGMGAGMIWTWPGCSRSQRSSIAWS